MSNTQIPLFPLPVVLFPGGRLPLRIFEPRYLDMVRECSAAGQCFGVCLVNDREDHNQPATHQNIGTTARIFDFSTLDGGLLGIVARGEQRFVIHSTRVRDNGLLVGEVGILVELTPIEVPEEYSLLSLIAGRMMEQLGEHYPSFQPADLQDAVWLGYRLAELLPLELAERQALLELTDPLQRLQILLEILPRFQAPGEA